MSKYLILLICILTVNGNAAICFICGYLFSNGTLELGSIADYLGIVVNFGVVIVAALTFFDQRKANRIAQVDNSYYNSARTLAELQSKYLNNIASSYHSLLKHFPDANGLDTYNHPTPKECQIVLMWYLTDINNENNTGYAPLFFHLDHTISYIERSRIDECDKKRYLQDLFSSIQYEIVVFYILYLLQNKEDKRLQMMKKLKFLRYASQKIVSRDHRMLLVEVLERATSQKMFVLNKISSKDILLETCDGESFGYTLDKVRRNEKVTNGIHHDYHDNN